MNAMTPLPEQFVSFAINPSTNPAQPSPYKEIAYAQGPPHMDLETIADALRSSSVNLARVMVSLDTVRIAVADLGRLVTGMIGRECYGVYVDERHLAL
jgi:hypothetical protein